MTASEQNHLRDLHPYLYRRVRRKGIVFTALGLGLILPSHLPFLHNRLNREQADTTRLYEYVPYDVWGVIFLVIGVGLLVALRRHSMRPPHLWLRASFMYAAFWLFALTLAMVLGNARSAAIVVLWWYLVTNLWELDHDPAWDGAELAKEVKEQRRGS